MDVFIAWFAVNKVKNEAIFAYLLTVSVTIY